MRNCLTSVLKKKKDKSTLLRVFTVILVHCRKWIYYFIYLSTYFGDRVSLHCHGWPQTHRNPSASTSQVLGWKRVHHQAWLQWHYAGVTWQYPDPGHPEKQLFVQKAWDSCQQGCHRSWSSLYYSTVSFTFKWLKILVRWCLPKWLLALWEHHWVTKKILYVAGSIQLGFSMEQRLWEHTFQSQAPT